MVSANVGAVKGSNFKTGKEDPEMAPRSLDAILAGRRSRPQQLIEVLMDVQEAFGYVPEEAMREISRELGVPLVEVLRVASFYKAFRLSPRGKHVLTMCTGTACHVRGSRQLLDQASGQIGVKTGAMSEDGLFTVEKVNCLGACALGPIVSEDGDYHHHMTPGKVRRLIEAIRRREGKEAGDA
jgi:NADH:ubiquinone oxidoreductase subunit E